jgi:hypothetical protein
MFPSADLIENTKGYFDIHAKLETKCKGSHFFYMVCKCSCGILDVIGTLSLCVVNYMTAFHCVMLMSFVARSYNYYMFSVLLTRNYCVPATDVVCTDAICKVRGNKICYVERRRSV